MSESAIASRATYEVILSYSRDCGHKRNSTARQNLRAAYTGSLQDLRHSKGT